MYITDKERAIISTFYSNLWTYGKEIMILKWDEENQVVARFDTDFDDDNGYDMDDANYEEFNAFIFEAIQVFGNPPISLSSADYFCVDYRNFPKEIIAAGKKIN